MSLALKFFIICVYAAAEYIAARIVLSRIPQDKPQTRQILIVSMVISGFIVAVMVLWVIPGPPPLSPDSLYR